MVTKVNLVLILKYIQTGEQFAMLYLSPRDHRLSPLNRQHTANVRCFSKISEARSRFVHQNGGTCF